MQNLINTENGDTPLQRHLGSYEKQMEKIKNYMTKAMDKYLQQKCFTEDPKKALRFLKSFISKSNSTEELLKIIDKTLSIAIIAQK